MAAPSFHGAAEGGEKRLSARGTKLRSVGQSEDGRREEAGGDLAPWDRGADRRGGRLGKGDARARDPA